MKILLVGLGRIGGSAAKALVRAGMIADGKDRPEVIDHMTRLRRLTL